MNSFFLASSVLSLVLTSTMVAQTRPDFSGTWRMDPARSESAMQAEPLKSMTVVIMQSPSEITMETTTERGKTKETYRLGPETGVVTDKPAVARWNGDVLITDVIRDVRGQSVTARQTRRLSASGNEMVVESIVEVQHGYTVLGGKNYGSGKDVFVKVRQ